MKKILSIFLSLIMLSGITAGVDLSAYADDYNATQIATNGTWYEGYITDTNTTNFYKITIPSDGTVTFKFMNFIDCAGFGIYNYDLSNRLYDSLFYASSSSPKTDTFTYDLSKGTYYLKIYKDGKNTGKYKVSATFNSFGTNEIEPNYYENAMSLTSEKSVTGAITKQDEVDWYKITVPVNCNITVNFKYYIYCVNLVLYNADLSKEIHKYSYYFGSPSSPEIGTFTYKLNKGIYYIKVYRDGSSTGKYNLSWKLNINVTKPTKFKVSSRSTSSLKLAWNKVSGVSGYQLQRKSGDNWKTIANTTSTSYTIKSLKAGTSYKLRVRSYKTLNGTKYYSSWVNLTTPTKPATVSFLSLKAGKKNFTAKWKKTTCTGYQIKYSTSSKFKNAKSVTVSKNSTTSKTISKLKSKKKYYVRVRAYKTVNGTKYYGAWSKTKSVKTK